MSRLMVFLVVLLVACVTQRHSSNLIVQNNSGEIVSWQTFPVVFTFHKDFPNDKKEIVQEEMNRFNTLSGSEIFKIKNQVISQSQPDLNKQDGCNTIYWDFNKAFKMTEAEQAKTSVFWQGAAIVESDINLKSAVMLDGVDFRTLIRHELFHTLGVQHVDNTLMNAYLPTHTVREWDTTLIGAWKNEVTKFAQIKFPGKPQSSTLASQK